jgi:lipopolysaccharide export system protein LptC
VTLPAAARPATVVHGLPSWPVRVRQALSAYLPLVLMLLLALSTWWLVKNSPQPQEPGGPVTLRHVPDYTMQRFAVQRFTREGAQRALLEGEQLRHYPDTDTLEIDDVRIRSVAPDGRVTTATARRAVSNGDGSEVQLLGGARVVSALEGEPPIEFEGEFLHAFLDAERVRSHLPVTVRQAGSELRAQGLDYDNLSRTVRLGGRVQARLLPGTRR